MTIDIQTPREGLAEEVMLQAKLAIIRFSRQYKAIQRLVCELRPDTTIHMLDNKVCEIKLFVYGENLFTHARTDHYGSALADAIGHMEQQLKNIVGRQKELPDKETTTVKV
jgi:hypothetical protein